MSQVKKEVLRSVCWLTCFPSDPTGSEAGSDLGLKARDVKFQKFWSTCKAYVVFDPKNTPDGLVSSNDDLWDRKTTFT